MSDRLQSILRSRGIQPTAQRLAVLHAVETCPHGTAEDVANLARAGIGTISHQAVYDALAVMVERRIIRRIEPAGSPARYETRVGDNHHHLICRACGKTEDVDCATGHAPCLSPLDSRGFALEEAEVIFWGTCPECSRGSKRTRKRRTSPRGAAHRGPRRVRT
ncbi:MAG: transcriptional repressor [Phycisphaeraceae bacterium]|nr:transcriptional repressor [Phycisphaeraceae bacterium]